MSEPIKVEVTLNLDEYLVRFRGYDQDGEEVVAPQTLEDVVIERAALTVARQVGKNATQYMESRARAIFEEVVREAIKGQVDAVLARSVQRTNNYGDPVGEPVPMTTVIVEKAVEQLRIKRDQYRATTVLEEFIGQQAMAAVRKELAEPLAEAKKQVKAAIEAEGAKILAETIEKLGGVK